MVLLKEATLARLRGELAARPANTLVSIVMPAWNRASTIGRAVESVLRQSYPNWELLVVDDGSTDGTAEAVEAVRGGRGNIRCLRIEHAGVSAARDEGLRAAKGGIIAYLDSDNCWHPDYLLFMVHALGDTGPRCGYAAMRVMDEDEGEAAGWRAHRFNLDVLLRNNYIDINIFAHRRELFEELGGFDRELRRWVDWDLILRYVERWEPIEIPAVLCDYFRHKRLHQITLEEPYAFKFKVLNKHLVNWTRLAEETPRRVPGRVSIIIPAYNLPELTRDCVRSIRKNTLHRDYEIVLVDNGGDSETAAALDELAAESERVRLVRNFENYMFSLGNNLGVAASTGEHIVLLNNDTRVTLGWLDPLIGPLASRPEIGMTGPKLLYEDGTVQAAGLAFPPNGKIPYHIYRGFPGDAPCVNRAREFQALTAACAAMRAADYIALGGLDPLYINGCEDLDLCFKMRRDLNKRMLYTPESTVYHLESKTPGRAKNIQHNRQLFVERWGEKVRPDDVDYYAMDGYTVVRHVKRGNDPDGPTASYVAEIKAFTQDAVKPPATAAARTLNIGIVSIWHVRGVTFVAKQVADALESEHLHTHVLARWEAARFFNGTPVHHPRVVNGGDDPSPEEVLDWARHNRLDAVIFFEVHPNDWKRVDALRRAGVRVIACEHLDVMRRESLDRYGCFDGFLHATFEGARVFRAKHRGIPSVTVPWGIPESALPAVKDRVRGDSSPLRFVHVAGWGGLNNRKNTDLLIRSWHRAAPKNAVLALYTQASPDRYGHDCERILRQDPTIELHEGTVEDIFEAYADADMLLWPSKREGLGLPVVEALACGLPVLISDGYMMKQWIIPGEHGVVCPAEPCQTINCLPEMRVNETVLAGLIADLAAHPNRMDQMAENVRRDRGLWLWNWQPEALRAQLRALLEDPAHLPDLGCDYLPAPVRTFEEKRRLAFGEKTPPQTAPLDGVHIEMPDIPPGRPMLLGPLVRRTYLDLNAPFGPGACLVVGVVDDAEANLLSAKGLQVTKADLHPRNASTIKLDITNPPRKMHDIYDVVVAFDVLEHIPDDRAAIRGIYDLLRQAGIALVHLPGGDINAPLDENDRKHGHARHGYSEVQAHDTVLEASWKEVRYLKTFNDIEMRAYHMAGEGRVEEAISLLRTSPFDGVTGRAHLFLLTK